MFQAVSHVQLFIVDGKYELKRLGREIAHIARVALAWIWQERQQPESDIGLLNHDAAVHS